MKETAKQHYQKQLETLHNLTWALDCYHVNEINRSRENEITWSDCADMGNVITQLTEIVRFIKSKGE